ncbi:TraR/DksA family transcriptional regulator [Pseudomonas juntendi]|uniref:TraR/DksA family transcriptional regulator n=1 Tax=Pseudomonas juntendi TaxID=2666183 RepID=UPI00244A588B|nr:TraR/DksA C4-type zinc finger protein [Pseudomonas juntendi]MDH1551016.1 TraR/DksA C4-type zinc finger protein [Pseudomonas juntendi]
MPDACDLVTDMQLDVAAAFMNRRAILATAVRHVVAAGADCRGCGRPIGLDRLQAVPDASKCMPCQAADEVRTWNC